MNRPKSAAARVRGATRKPYLTKSPKANFTSCLVKMEVNISPASAPSGVRYAPIFEPITVL